MHNRRILFLIISLFILNDNLSASSNTPKDSVSHVLYLIGNTGNNKKQDDLLALKGMTNELKSEKDSSTVLILGNLFCKNLFTQGMNLPEQKLDSIEIIRIFKDVDTFSNHVFINPGQYEWSLSNQSGYHCTVAHEYLIEKFLFEGNTFLPDNGCPGPEEIELGDNTVLLFIDTQWWLNQELENEEWKNLTRTRRNHKRSATKARNDPG